MQQLETTPMTPTVQAAVKRLGARLGDQWRAGQRLPTVRQLAGQLDVSPPTAYRAMRQLVRGGFLVSRARSGVFVSERFTDERLRSIFAQQSVQGGSEPRSLEGKRVMLFSGSLSTHMLPAVSAIEAALASTGCVLIRNEYFVLGQQPTEEFLPQADAVMIVNPDIMLDLRCRPGQHLVLVTSAAGLPRVASPVYDLVSVDQEHGAEQAGRYLRQAGCASVCMLGVAHGQEPSRAGLEMTSQVRLSGLERGWGVKLKAEELLYAVSYSPFGGACAAKRYVTMNPRPQGVFAASDDLAVGFVNGLTALGLEMNRDYHLVGFDGQSGLSGSRPGGVPTVVVPAATMGRYAADLLISRFAEPGLPLRKVLLGGALNRPMGSAETSSH